MDLGSSSVSGLKRVDKPETSENGLRQNMLYIQSGSKHLADYSGLSKAWKKIPTELPVDGYNYSMHGIKVGKEEDVLVIFTESVNHFYCQLTRNSQVLDKLWKSISNLPNKLQSSDCQMKLNSICLAKYSDNQWYRGLIVQSSPKLKVNFVDYGETLAVPQTDIRPFPPEAIIARSVPVQAVSLGLYNVPPDTPQEVNKWFAECALEKSFTISVVEKGNDGKLLVEMFDGSLSVNAMVRDKVRKMRLPNKTAMSSKDGDRFVSKKATVSNKDFSPPELARGSVLDNPNTDMCATYVVSPEVRQGMPLDIILENSESKTDTFIQSSHSDIETTRLSSDSYLKQDVVGLMYRWPNICKNMILDVYASCIAGPQYFWCQPANTETLDNVLSLTKDAAKAQDMISPEHFEPGSPCLALFSEDNQWYRALVTGKGDETVHVLFVDYGNECDVEKKYIRSLPKNLLEIAPQAFLCCLEGFESKGSWDEKVYDEFYSIIVDKPLKVIVAAMDNNSEIAVPQHAVTTQCDEIVVNKVLEKYWKPSSEEHSGDDVEQTQTSKDLYSGDIYNPDASKENMTVSMFKQPEVIRAKTEMVYASCISEPKFFWCQFADTEDLSKVSQEAQKAGEEQDDVTFSQSLGPGSHCLALFPDDKQWYRALVVEKSNKIFHVLFIDYGNESDIDVQDVRPLPQSLQEMAPQAFLCRLMEFDESKGSWDEQAYDVFYNLLVDKPLNLTVVSEENYSEIPVPQYSVEVECEGVSINALMQQHWKV
ncbi:PREDICTED: tudor domain-containing protein 6-like [Cyprinodon variegatus]|nr:PREDICTED: tudor domain-containing protein 6-like [Cyprinodon variegatus]